MVGLRNGLIMEIVEHTFKHKKAYTNRKKTTELIVHCAATPEGKDFTVDDIHRWHLKRGFNAIGYQYVIYRDGSIHRGRPETSVGGHCTNHNSISIGICYIGGVAKDGKTPKDTRTDAQKSSLIELLTYLKKKYPGVKIYGHNEFAKKACPSFSVKKEYGNL